MSKKKEPGHNLKKLADLKPFHMVSMSGSKPQKVQPIRLSSFPAEGAMSVLFPERYQTKCAAWESEHLRQYLAQLEQAAKSLGVTPAELLSNESMMQVAQGFLGLGSGEIRAEKQPVRSDAWDDLRLFHLWRFVKAQTGNGHSISAALAHYISRFDLKVKPQSLNTLYHREAVALIEGEVHSDFVAMLLAHPEVLPLIELKCKEKYGAW